MDRLARTSATSAEIVMEQIGRGVGVEFVKEHSTFTNGDKAMSKLLMSVFEERDAQTGEDPRERKLRA